MLYARAQSLHTGVCDSVSCVFDRKTIIILILKPFHLLWCRRERDNSESERAQLLKKIHDFQEHIQDKETQILALEEQVGCFVWPLLTDF